MAEEKKISTNPEVKNSATQTKITGTVPEKSFQEAVEAFRHATFVHRFVVEARASSARIDRCMERARRLQRLLRRRRSRHAQFIRNHERHVIFYN